MKCPVNCRFKDNVGHTCPLVASLKVLISALVVLCVAHWYVKVTPVESESFLHDHAVEAVTSE